MMELLLLIGSLGIFSNYVVGQSCNSVETIYAEEDLHTFNSHALYGVVDYYPNEYKCWVIEAPEDQVVYLETEFVDLETGCSPSSRDRINIYDGNNGDAELVHHVCGNELVIEYRASGRYAYVEFITDDTVEREGFRMQYWSQPEEDDDGVIIGIVVGVLLGICIIIAVIVLCVYCSKAKKSQSGKVHSTTRGQTLGQQNQHRHAYPTQPAGYPREGAAPVMAFSFPTKVKAGPPPAPAMMQSHPVDANGVPMPAIYIEP